MKQYEAAQAAATVLAAELELLLVGSTTVNNLGQLFDRQKFNDAVLEAIATYEATIKETKSPPSPGSMWKHYNGATYQVICLANEPDTERYPLTVIYQGVNGKFWARRADDWHRSMTEITE